MTDIPDEAVARGIEYRMQGYGQLDDAQPRTSRSRRRPRWSPGATRPRPVEARLALACAVRQGKKCSRGTAPPLLFDAYCSVKREQDCASASHGTFQNFQTANSELARGSFHEPGFSARDRTNPAKDSMRPGPRLKVVSQPERMMLTTLKRPHQNADVPGQSWWMG